MWSVQNEDEAIDQANIEKIALSVKIQDYGQFLNVFHIFRQLDLTCMFSRSNSWQDITNQVGKRPIRDVRHKLVALEELQCDFLQQNSVLTVPRHKLCQD